MLRNWIQCLTFGSSVKTDSVKTPCNADILQRQVALVRLKSSNIMQTSAIADFPNAIFENMSISNHLITFRFVQDALTAQLPDEDDDDL